MWLRCIAGDDGLQCGARITMTEYQLRLRHRRRRHRRCDVDDGKVSALQLFTCYTE